MNGLKIGTNQIKIEVESENEVNKKTYNIYVTKTNEPEKANTNLEILAIEHHNIEPEFHPAKTQYKINVSSSTERVNIFAVSESSSANVHIKNKDILDFGLNKIYITVMAENGFTTKDYILQIYRNTKQEDKKEEIDKSNNAKRLDEILEEKAIEKISSEDIDEKVNKEPEMSKRVRIIIVIFIVSILIVIFIILWKKRIIS